jgi:nitrite reductase/ring-hydroxylating ferredoxin subunit
MTSGVSTNSGLWCRLVTAQPVDPGNVVTATIVGVQINQTAPGTGDEQAAKSARGREIVAWRAIDGVLHLSEARCPHQFVHLASSGTVDGCELVCTAHFWRFTSNGEGSLRDSFGHREPVSALTVFPLAELQDQIWGYLPKSFVVAGD